MTPPVVKRRCWRFDCQNWLELDPFDPEDLKRHYCCRECEDKDLAEIAHAQRCWQHRTLEQSITLARARLRQALAKPNRLSIALETRPVWKNRTRFLWIDYIAHTSGDLATVPEAQTEALMEKLLDELHAWKTEAGTQKAKGATA